MLAAVARRAVVVGWEDDLPGAGAHELLAEVALHGHAVLHPELSPEHLVQMAAVRVASPTNHLQQQSEEHRRDDRIYTDSEVTACNRVIPGKGSYTRGNRRAHVWWTMAPVEGSFGGPSGNRSFYGTPQ